MSDPASDFVEHPRYGRSPRRTGLDAGGPGDGTVFLHWHSPPECRIPGTAIVARPDRQNAPTVPVTHYYDVRRTCRDCECPFLFFAEEQRHWYEELGFVLDADCVHCAACRRARRGFVRSRARYEELSARSERSHEEDLELVECALQLIEGGQFGGSPRLLQTLRPLLHRIAPVAALRTRQQAAHQKLDQISSRTAPLPPRPASSD